MASRKRKATTLASRDGYDRSRFVSQEAWDRYLDNVLARNILTETNVKLYINEFDDFRRELIRRNWHKKLTNLTERSIDVAIVMEFYENLYVPDDKFPKQVRVRGHLEILIPGDRCRTGCHDITLQNMQIICVRMNRLNK